MRPKHLFLLLFLVLLALGCKKDKDGTAPSVRIISPTEGETLSIPDTLLVRVEVSDDHIVESVTIDLLNTDGISVVTSALVSVQGPSATVERELIVNSEQLLSGTYTVVARATDGHNDGRAFRSIQLLEAPWRLRSIFVAPPFSTSTSTILRVDSVGAVSSFITLQDFNGIAADGRSQHLMVAGSQFAPFQAIPTNGGNAWQINVSQNDAPEQFAAITVDPFDGITYFSTREGMIRGFTGTGSSRFNAQCYLGHRCEAVVVLGDRIATWQRAIVGGAQVLVAYGPAGTVLASLPVEHERIGLFRINETSVMLFCNEAGAGLIERLNIDAAGTPDQYTFPEGPIVAVARLDADRFAVALPEQLVIYRSSTQTTFALADLSGISALAFDPATGSLFAAQGSTLLTLDPSSGQTVGNITVGMDIGSIHPLRNR